MLLVFRLLHLLGLALLLGSIAVYIALSQRYATADPARFAEVRLFIAAGAHAITLPGLWLAVASGAALAWRKRPLPGWLKLKLALVLLIVLNAHGVVVPALDEAARLAVQAAQSGIPDPGVSEAVRREWTFGAANLVLCLGVLILAVRRPKGRDERAVGGGLPS
jgi:uncharacterized membrane protein